MGRICPRKRLSQCRSFVFGSGRPARKSAEWRDEYISHRQALAPTSVFIINWGGRRWPNLRWTTKPIEKILMVSHIWKSRHLMIEPNAEVRSLLKFASGVRNISLHIASFWLWSIKLLSLRVCRRFLQLQSVQRRNKHRTTTMKLERAMAVWVSQASRYREKFGQS